MVEVTLLGHLEWLWIWGKSVGYEVGALTTAWHGARNRDRTCGLIITNDLLYQLSYPGAQGGGV